MATAPDDIRAGLGQVTAASIAEVVSIASASSLSAAARRAALFDSVPMIVGAYAEGSAALALDWYDERREEANPRTPYSPTPVALVNEAKLAKSVAWATEDLWLADRGDIDDLPAATKTSLARLDGVVQRAVAAGFWDTMTTNVKRDPASTGWKRFARADACSFCRLLADKGAIYRPQVARFAAHDNCHCVAAPVFHNEVGPEADVYQYLASDRKRTPEERRKLRDYLDKKYGA